jgi:orotate phosphoribosyltransferase
MHYRSVRDLTEHVREWSERLPPEVDLVVGIPRSGLLVANLVALYRNIPMTDVEGLLAGRLLSAGKRITPEQAVLSHDRPRQILVVDDSLWSGGQLGKVRDRIIAADLPHNVRYGAVYVVPESARLVDTFHSKVPIPRVFEWNILHHPLLGMSCVSFEALAGQPAHGDLPPPRLQPTYRISHIVAMQPPEAEAGVQAWLQRHGIVYDQLVLVPPGDLNSDAVISRKAEIYRTTRSWLYFESTSEAASRLALATRRPVFALDTWEMLYPGWQGATSNRMPLWMRATVRMRQKAKESLAAVRSVRSGRPQTADTPGPVARRGPDLPAR